MVATAGGRKSNIIIIVATAADKANAAGVSAQHKEHHRSLAFAILIGEQSVQTYRINNNAS